MEGAGGAADTDHLSGIVDGDGAGGDGADLVDAVDALDDVSTQPVHTHAARYHEVHTLLQDALSATDRPGS
jgi:hypothetical protein